MTTPVNLAVLLSGGGTTLQNFIDRIAAGRLDARIRLVIASRADAYGLVRAQQAGLPTALIASREYHKDWDRMSAAVTAELVKHEVELIALAGYMCLYRIPPQFEGRVLNIHPALIPAFCGHGMYGHHVHEAVVESGVKVSGCTVHFADNHYDHGPIIVQRTCPVLDDDTPDTLAARVFAQECEAYPEAIQLFAEGRLRIEGKRVKVSSKQ